METIYEEDHPILQNRFHDCMYTIQNMDSLNETMLSHVETMEEDQKIELIQTMNEVIKHLRSFAARILI